MEHPNFLRGAWLCIPRVTNCAYNAFIHAKSFCCVQLCVTLWTVACQAPLSMGFSRQEYWSGFPCPPPGNLPDSGIEPASLTYPALAGGSLPLAPPTT